MKIVPESHLDHGLSQAAIEWLTARYAERDGFFIETVELPSGFGTLECGLHGPLVGDEPVSEGEVTYAVRGAREYPSRMVARAARPTRLMTVIAGPHGAESCVLYTAFGGPLAPQEPGDPSCKDVEASKQFWAVHALSV